MTPERLAEIEARAAACFRGPWKSETWEVECADDECNVDEHDVETILAPDEYPSEQVVAQVDDRGRIHVPGLERFAAAHARFIAAARTDVPDLVARVRELEERLREVTGWDRRAANRLADEVAALVRRGVLDARSPAADALLDYRSPPSSPRADRLAELEARAARDRAEARTVALEEAAKVADAIAQHHRDRKSICQDCQEQETGREAAEEIAEYIRALGKP